MKTKPASFSPKVKFPKGHRWPGANRCQAWKPGLARQCRKLARKGKRTCKTCGSGGRPPIHGRYSQLAQLQTRAERALGDPKILDLRAELAILSLRGDDLIGQIANAESPPDWAEIEKTTSAIISALRYGDSNRASRAADHLLTLAESGRAEREIWDELRITFLAMDKLARTQTARELETAALVPWLGVLQVLAIFQQMMFHYISNNSQRLAFTKEFKSKFPYETEPAQLEDSYHETKVQP